jgi:hypothetical protein
MMKMTKATVRLTESSVLLREGIELPSSLRVTGGEFLKGWNLMRPGGAGLLERRIRKFGWHFIRMGDETRQGGVGESSQLAIASALQLALCNISEYFNAMEVRNIHLSRYPWFVLARLGVFPCRIQQSPVQFVPDDALPLPVLTRSAQLPVNASWLFPQVGREMPIDKEMLTRSMSED